jgi:hypothetical protein
MDAKPGDVVTVEFFDHTPLKDVEILAELTGYACKDSSPHYLAVDDQKHLDVIVFWSGGWVQCFDYLREHIVHALSLKRNF